MRQVVRSAAQTDPRTSNTGSCLLALVLQNKLLCELTRRNQWTQVFSPEIEKREVVRFVSRTQPFINVSSEQHADLPHKSDFFPAVGPVCTSLERILFRQNTEFSISEKKS